MQLGNHEHTIQQICQNNRIHWLPMHGFMPIQNDDYLWCPQANNPRWKNIISSDGTRIDEIPGNDPRDQNQYVEDMIKAQQQRVTWHKGTRNPIQDYVFVGVFTIDAEESRKAKHCIWKRIATTYPSKKK